MDQHAVFLCISAKAMGSCAGIQLAERPSFYSQSASQVSIREAIDKAKAAKESNFLSCSKQCPDMS